MLDGLYDVNKNMLDFDLHYFEDVSAGKCFLQREVDFLKNYDTMEKITTSMETIASHEKV